MAMELFTNIIIPHKFIPTYECVFLYRAGHYINATDHSIERVSGELENEAIAIYCVAGKGWLEFNGLKKMVLPGMLLFCDCGVPHLYGADPSSPWTIYWIHFGGSFTKEFANSLNASNVATTFELGNLTNIERYMQKILFILRNPLDSLHIFDASTQLRLLLLETLKLQSQENIAKEDSFFVDKTVAFMNTNLHNQLELDQLAHHVNLSKYHFARKFKALTGRTPIQYFTSLKLDRAKMLLLTTQLTVSEISRDLNFTTPFYFSETFKKHTGFSPKEYRQVHCKNY